MSDTLEDYVKKTLIQRRRAGREGRGGGVSNKACESIPMTKISVNKKSRFFFYVLLSLAR